MADDDEVQGPSWMRRVDPRFRRALAIGLFFGLSIVLRLLGLSDWLASQSTAFVAVPVMLIGVAGIVVACGPNRWVERESLKARRSPVPLGTSLLGRMPLPVLRAFFLLVGTAAVAAGGWLLLGS
jgi:hypothetical protein